MSANTPTNLTRTPAAAPFKLVAFDMDSTLIQAECIDEIAKEAGVGDEVAQVTEAAMRGELDFTQSLTNRVALLKGLDVSVLESVYDRIELMPGAEGLIATLKANGIKTAILSGGFVYFASRFAGRLGIDAYHCNDLGVQDGKLNGQTLGPIVDAQAKADHLVALADRWGIPLEQTASVGDGANDLKVMAAAGLGVAFCAKPTVQEQADVAVNDRDLTAVLPLLGLAGT
ncbi:MAG: phosphoserine phosphatase SerB [Phycisphaeraceae bacterium]|nr:phosphoserine phosphatase SerB [Phycisphaeraceae bacterium]